MPFKSCATLVKCSRMPCIKAEERLQTPTFLLALLCFACNTFPHVRRNNVLMNYTFVYPDLDWQQSLRHCGSWGHSVSNQKQRWQRFKLHYKVSDIRLSQWLGGQFRSNGVHYILRPVAVGVERVLLTFVVVLVVNWFLWWFFSEHLFRWRI